MQKAFKLFSHRYIIMYGWIDVLSFLIHFGGTYDPPGTDKLRVDYHQILPCSHEISVVY